MLYSDRDATFEKLVDLLLRTTNERDEAVRERDKLRGEIWQRVAFPQSFGMQPIPADCESGTPRGEAGDRAGPLVSPPSKTGAEHGK